MRILGNILWLVLGGIFMALAYAIAGLISFILIITIPFGIQAFKLAGFALWPFGRVMVPRAEANVTLSVIGNIIWLIAAGIWLALGHVFAAVLNALTIIGIPFAIAHLKLAGAALVPFGNTVVSAEEATARGQEVRVLIEPIR